MGSWNPEIRDDLRNARDRRGTGYYLSHLEPVLSIYSSPGGSLEMVHLFLGEYGKTPGSPAAVSLAKERTSK